MSIPAAAPGPEPETPPAPPPQLAPEVREWFAQNFDQTISRQRSQADTAKLLVTFALGVSATIVATALQVTATSKTACIWAASALGLAFVLALLVILRDRVTEPNRGVALEKALMYPKSPDDVLDVLREMQTDTRKENEDVLRGIMLLAAFQLAASACAGVIAAVTLLVSKT